MAAAAIGTTRRAGLLAVAVGGTVFGGYRMYQREAEEMPAAAPPPGTLYAEAARRGDGATSCAVCAAVAPSSLGAVSHGSNYAKIDAATLLRGVAALEAGLDGEVVGPEAVSTSFGAERLVRRGTGSAHACARLRPYACRHTRLHARRHTRSREPYIVMASTHI